MAVTTFDTDARPMLFAEAVTFDPEVVIAVFIVLLLMCAAALAVTVTGVVAGFRAGRDPGRTRAVTAWQTCLGIDAAALAIAALTRAPMVMTATIAAVTVATWASRRLGRGFPA